MNADRNQRAEQRGEQPGPTANAENTENTGGTAAEDPRAGKPGTGEVYSYILNPDTAAMVSDQAKQAVHYTRSLVPEMADIAQNSRVFVRRMTRYLVEHGITQILDIGCGLPTDNNTHEVAQAINPATNVVYVDSDARTAEQAQRLVTDLPNVAFIAEDLCDRAAVLEHPETRRLIDFSKPVGLIMASVLHVITEQECQAIAGTDTHTLVRGYVDALPSGSYFAFESATWEDVDLPRAQAAMEHVHAVLRSVDEIRRYLDGTELVAPFRQDDGTRDVVWSNAWRAPDPWSVDPSGRWIRAGVGYKA